MRVVFAGVGHWHMPIYSVPLKAIPGVEIVGVTDPDPARAAEIAAPETCVADTDLARLVGRLRPDPAIVLGRHSEVASDAHVLIESRVPS